MNPKYHLLVAVAALSLSACTTDDTCTGPEIGGQKITFTIAEDSETRTTLDKDEKGVDILKWVSTDKVGIYTVGKNENPNTLTIVDVSKSPVEFSGTLAKTVSSGDMFYAYYPYDAAQSPDPTAVKFSIPAEQTQTVAGVYNGQSQPLVAVPMEFTSPQENKDCHLSNVHFRLLGAIVELQLFSSDEALRSEKIRSVTFESEYIALAGCFSFDLTTVTTEKEPQIKGYETNIAIEVTTSLDQPAAIPAARGEAARIYLTIAPGQYTGKIVVTTDVAQYTFSLAKAMTFERAVIKGLAADLAGAERDAFIQFADPLVKQICVGNWWDENSDGQLSYKEAAAVTWIGTIFKEKSISSFDELRYFTGLKTIAQSAFDNCSSLTSIRLPDGVTSIEDYAFTSCSSLKSIRLPDGMTTIGASAFDGCSSLTSINIPNGVTSIGRYAFRGCSSLSAFEGKYASTDNCCLIRDGKLFAFAPAGLTKYTIPNEVTSIGESAFEGCSRLKNIDIPNGVIAIEERAFRGCSSLMSIDIPNGVTAIELTAFMDCSSLTSIRLPDKVTAIRTGAFMGCSSLTSIHIPDGVTAIEGWAFRDCSSLTSVYCKPTTPPILDSDVFLNTPASMQIYVPSGSADDYKKATNWSSFASQIVAE